VHQRSSSAIRAPVVVSRSRTTASTCCSCVSTAPRSTASPRGPAGKRDVDGEPPEATAHRELEEEIGTCARPLVPLAEFYNSPGFSDEYTYLYAASARRARRSATRRPAEEDAMQIERVALADVARMIATREIVDAKTIIGLTLGACAPEARGP
jgi:8-oxo-dGTP pyrophosphatase MutT (NUDIX family)